ncbi:MAG: histidine ammonia-lyase [Bacteroidetes bacterium]|nr:histidine ammonia-lyase [Bacteroidota bacterium]
MKPFQISSKELDLNTLDKILSTGGGSDSAGEENSRIALSQESREEIIRCRKYLDRKMESGDRAYYGINTGLGALHNIRIPAAELTKIQENLLVSHACGCGDEVQDEIVRIMLLLKIHSLALGNSGVSTELVNRLIDFFNLGILPVVYEQGSLGASGDLAPLAHLSLPLIGIGEARFNGKKESASKILSVNRLSPLRLKTKEGLALLNGTQFMCAYGVWILLRAKRLSLWADMISAISSDAFLAKTEPLDPLIHKVRPHEGQMRTAQRIMNFLKGSQLGRRKKNHVQDPYSFRCIPQVHGASADAIGYAERVLATEINSVTDNPIIFPEEDKILSGGNFHGQPLALAFDFLAIALSELGSISERRTFLMLSGQRELPNFLIHNPGPNSGFMILQYTAAALVSQNKQFCTPASVDTVVSSNGQEDHVSMGANAVVKCRQVLKNLETILAIELLTAVQALDFRKPEKSSPAIDKLVKQFRKSVPYVKEDTYLHPLMEEATRFINSNIPLS